MENNNQRKVTLQQALDFIYCHLDPQLYKVLNVYLFGSRVYKCNTPDSDFDLIVIVEGEPYFGQSVMIENEDMNVNIYHKDFFKDILEQHLNAIVLCVFLPSEFVWLETYKFPFELKMINLKRAALQDGSHNLAKGRRLWSEGDKKKAKKNVVHGLRYLDFAMQLVHQGCIHTPHNGNKYWDEIMNCQVDEWDYYEKKYRPLYQEIFHFLEHNIPPPSIPPNREFTEKLRIIEFIRSFGMARLRKEFSIETTESPKYKGLYLISANPVFSPPEHPIVQECWHGLILQKTITEDLMEDDVPWKVISCPFFKWFEHDSLFAFKMDEKLLQHNNIVVSEKIDGYLMTLYHFDGQWFVASRDNVFHGEPVAMYYHSKISYRGHLSVRPFVEDPLKVHHTTWKPPHSDPPIMLNQKFWSIWNKLNYKLPTDTELCYVFEMVFPGQKSILNHDTEMLYLVGARNVNTMDEIDVWSGHFAETLGWNIPQTTTFNGIQDLISQSMMLNPFKQEGFVICISSSSSNLNNNNKAEGPFRQLSVKSQLHVEMKLLIKENSPLWRADFKTNQRILTNIIRVTTYQRIVQQDNSVKADQLFLGIYPQWKDLYQEVNKQFQEFIQKVKTAHETLKSVQDRKMFASAAKKYPFYGCLFEFRDNDPPEAEELIPYKFFAFCRYKLLSKWMSAK